MKTIKIFAIIIATFAVNNSSWGQNYAGEKTATTAENVDLTSWIAPVGVAAPRYLLKVVAEEVDPSVVKSGVNEWNSPNREFPIGYPTGYETAQWAPSLLPGTYYISGEEKGKVLYDISYITNLWVGINQTATTASPHLTSFNGTITAQNFVSLKLSGIFVSGKFTNELIKIVNGTVQSMGVHKDEYQISESGDYAVSVIYTASDYSYSADTYLKVNITGTTTPTVDNVIVSPASASVNKGAGQAFTASVQGQNNPGQGVSWTIEGNTSAATTISSTGYLSVAENENATQLTVRATS
ncbi:MAG: Ig-like domain-containing protein, partial [Candidatus Peribacteria bacterium]|nr:Ig-like domain-containing protein [Candidatus Peribacteria bacterium]